MGRDFQNGHTLNLANLLFRNEPGLGSMILLCEVERQNQSWKGAVGGSGQTKEIEG